MLSPPKVLFSVQKSSRHRGQRAESSQWFGDRCCAWRFSPLEQSTACGQALRRGRGSGDMISGPALNFLCFPDHSPHLLNLPSARRWTVWTSLPLAYSWVCWRGSTSNKPAGRRRRKPRYLFSWLFPLWCRKGVSVSLHKGLRPFRRPTLYIPPSLWVLLTASCLQSCI